MTFAQIRPTAHYFVLIPTIFLSEVTGGHCPPPKRRSKDHEGRGSVLIVLGDDFGLQQ